MTEADICWWQIIQAGVDRSVSDVYLTAGQVPYFRIAGTMQPFSAVPVPTGLLAGQLEQLLTAYQQERLCKERTLDFSCMLEGRRFRGNAYYQQERLALVLRLLPDHIPTMESLHCPSALQDLLMAEQGLVLVCGRTGAGKTTTLAAFLNAVNQGRSAHIITLEDPIEYVFQPDRCFISQRELGKDFFSFPQALRSALRESPDIVLVGEIRDRETLQTALMAAEAGMLVLGTLHTREASEAVMRMQGLFPPGQQESARIQLAEVLSGIFAQQLIPSRQGGRVCLTEVLLTNPAVQSLIRQGKYTQLESVMLQHQSDGMQTRRMAAANLYEAGLIGREVWRRYDTSAAEALS